MKKIFYFSHVPWAGSKQRPQFVAEHLRKQFDLDVFHMKDYHTSHLTDLDKSVELTVRNLFRLPLQRFPFIIKLNKILIKLQIFFVIRNYNIIWITHPSLFMHVEPFLKKNTNLIYDCMDDALEFPATKRNQQEAEMLASCERALLTRANIVFVSSEHLGTVVTGRGASPTKVTTINNAIEISKFQVDVAPLPKAIQQSFNRLEHKIIYVGTIGEWFDFNLILKMLDRYQDTVCYLVGYKEASIPVHDRLLYLGMVEHRYVAGIMKNADLLVMPFMINDLILSVNPVKLYEYIYSNIPCLAIRYPETEKFEPYVNLYGNELEFFTMIEDLINGTLPGSVSLQAKREFVYSNTWENRIQDMVEILVSHYN